MKLNEFDLNKSIKEDNNFSEFKPFKAENYFPNERHDYSKDFKVFNDTEDIRTITDLNDYAVLLYNGINLKEGLQNRQDACIKINVLFNKNIWVKLKASKKLLQENENILIKFLNEIKINA